MQKKSWLLGGLLLALCPFGAKASIVTATYEGIITSVPDTFSIGSFQTLRPFDPYTFSVTYDEQAVDMNIDPTIGNFIPEFLSWSLQIGSDFTYITTTIPPDGFLVFSLQKNTGHRALISTQDNLTTSTSINGYTLRNAFLSLIDFNTTALLGVDPNYFPNFKDIDLNDFGNRSSFFLFEKSNFPNERVPHRITSISFTTQTPVPIPPTFLLLGSALLLIFRGFKIKQKSSH